VNTKRVNLFLVGLVWLAATLACAMPTAPTPTAAPTQALQPTTAPTTAPALPTSPPPQPTTALPVPTAPLAPTTPPEQTVNQVTFYLVALEDDGKSGVKIGCGDSLVAVTQPVDATNVPVNVALEKLFSYKTQFVGESGLYTALYQSDLKVDSVDRGPAGDVRVALSGTVALGGVCDNPRFQGQIEQTILASSGASAVNVTINGKPLSEIVSGR
jgi:hypothetical protein